MKHSVYFPGLNGIRFLAAYAVVIHHIEQFKSLTGFHNLWGSWLVFNLGKKGVSLFFVLSGFLITYLLLTEIAEQGRIQTCKFYLRRILRIWPLYYFIVLISFFVFYHFIDLGGIEKQVLRNFDHKLFLYTFFLPNLAIVMYQPVLGCSQLWSIGVEEQFYLLWPHVVRIFRGKFVAFSLCFVSVKVLLQGVLLVLESRGLLSGSPIVRIMLGFLQTLEIENMAIGGIGAYLLIRNSPLVSRSILHPVVRNGAVLGLLLVLFAKPNLPFFNIVDSLIFIVLIMNAASGQAFNWLELPLLDELGKVSYGIYMYHPLIVCLLISLLKKWGVGDGLGVNLLIYAVVTASVLGISYLSYHCFEKQFLKLKRYVSEKGTRVDL